MTKASVFYCMGARNCALDEREEHDYYATEPKAVDLLLAHEKFCHDVWEPACGEGHIAKQLKAYGYDVFSSDLINRGYGQCGLDFLKEEKAFSGDIITNPPYKYAREFAEKALSLVTEGHKVALFLKLTFLEGKARKKFFLKQPFSTLYVSSSRLNCAKNGNFDKYQSSAVAYGWYVWVKGFTGNPIIRWIN